MVITKQLSSNPSHQPQHIQATVKLKDTTTTNTSRMEIATIREQTTIVLTTIIRLPRANHNLYMVTKDIKECTIKMLPATIQFHHSQCTTIRETTLVSITSRILTTLSNQRPVYHTMATTMPPLHRLHITHKLKVTPQSQ